MTDERNNAAAPAGAGQIGKIAIVLVLAAAIAGAFYLKQGTGAGDAAKVAPAAAVTDATATPKALPRLVDLGADKCIPCKMMAPILEELKKEHEGKLEVTFIDVWKKPDAAAPYNINLIPTQIFFGADGKELFRHEGFFAKEDILAKWKELGVDLKVAAAKSPAPAEAAFNRLEPTTPDARAKEAVCYMCDGDVNPKTRTVMVTDKGDVVFCSPHCFFITWSSMPANPPNVAAVSVTDWSAGTLIPADSAKYVYGVDAENRPTIKAFADAAAAVAEQQAAGGDTVEWAALQDKEIATRCGFCDRAVYPEDACAVKVEGGLSTLGCCTMCALGVAARMQKDIEITAKDALTGESIQVKTVGGNVGVLEPKTAVAWAGTKKDAGGKLVSTGCFKQAFFVNEDNLKKWVEAHPTATGRLVSINQALAEKMKLTPEQIGKACKIGECVPK
jgi:thioredoxin 1